MKSKKYLTLDEQINLLKSKNLNFKNEDFARHQLYNIGYYKLINAYRRPFVKIINDTYEFFDNVYFEDILYLYNFDRKLKSLIFEVCTTVEIKIKSIMSNIISSKYGIEDKKYLNASNFRQDNINNSQELKFIDLKNCIKKTVKKQYQNNQLSIKWYKDNYGFYPFWVLSNVLPIGVVSKIYSKMDLKDQMEMAKVYKLPSAYLESFICHINLIRNICAHNDVLFSYKSINSIPQKIKNVKEIYEKLDISINTKSGKYENGTNDFLSTIIVLKFLLSDTEFSDFKSKLIFMLKELKEYMSENFYNEIIKRMGLVNNWSII